MGASRLPLPQEEPQAELAELRAALELLKGSLEASLRHVERVSDLLRYGRIGLLLDQATASPPVAQDPPPPAPEEDNVVPIRKADPLAVKREDAKRSSGWPQVEEGGDRLSKELEGKINASEILTRIDKRLKGLTD
jgi:hypothetical protein